MKQAIIQTANLTKVYRGSVKALDSLSLSVQAGEIFGYLGPNGAGKTTTIKLLLDLIRPTAGSATMFGLDVQRDGVALRGRIGFLPGELNLWDDQTGRQIIGYIGGLRGGANWQRVNELAERLQFDLTKTMRSYSTGNKRKLGIILAMMNQPDLLILDEPTSGLDPLMQQTFYQLVLEARDSGATVFMSSHMLNEVQQLCDRVGILRGGKLVQVQTVQELTRADFRHVTLRFRDAARVNGIERLPGVRDLQVDGKTIHLRLLGDFDPLLRAVDGQYIEDIAVQEPTLEDIFLTFYGDAGSANHNGQRRAEAAGKGR